MVRTRFALILYFRMMAHIAACHTLSKPFLKSLKTWYRFCLCYRYFSHRILRLKICSTVLLLAQVAIYSFTFLYGGKNANIWGYACLLGSKFFLPADMQETFPSYE